MSDANNPLRLNVGFIINLPVGEYREFSIDIPKIHLKPDLNLEYLHGAAKLTRTAQGVLVQVNLSATTNTECVRCLSAIDLPLSTTFTELYAFSPGSVSENELILPEDAQINLSGLVREYLLLDIPISPLCSIACKGLCPVCGENQNEKTCHHVDDDIDPRLSALKSLLDS